MAIPDYQTCMLPLLQHVSDGNEHFVREVYESLATQFELTPAEISELLPSGKQAIFHNRVGWANSYLKKAGLLDSPKRGVIKISSRGVDVLSKKPTRIDVKFLEQFPEFIEFRTSTRSTNDESNLSSTEPQERTPEEVLELAHQNIRKELAQEILTKILSCSPAFFENLVVELLVTMGYGGSRKDAGERIGQSGDGGIDGIIKEDRLGLDAIYIQAKRWQGSVGRPEIQKFVGALQGQRAKKGVFITTSTFTQDAKNYVSNIDTKVVLIDGQLLANLMMDFDVGVSVAASYVVKKIDSDYFDEN
jgi:restriction system protein